MWRQCSAGFSKSVFFFTEGSSTTLSYSVTCSLFDLREVEQMRCDEVKSDETISVIGTDRVFARRPVDARRMSRTPGQSSRRARGQEEAANDVA
jgi:hypothetical protein